MIRATQHNTLPAGGANLRQAPRATGARRADFAAILNDAVPAGTARDTAMPQTTAAAEDGTAIPGNAAAPAAATALGDMFSPGAVEAHMNEWLMDQLQQQNTRRMEEYNNALDGWKNVSRRNTELGIAVPPPPSPPELAPVEPMPPGWWFQTAQS